MIRDVVGGLAVERHPAGGTDGNPAAVVVVVHGTMDRSSSFRRATRRAPDLDVVLYDRRGYAGSPAVEPSADPRVHLDDLRAVIEWTGAGRVTVVGHSLGGLLALHAASWAPWVAAVGSFEAPLPWLDWYRSSAGEAGEQLGRAEGPEETAEAFMRAMVGDRLWERLPSRAREGRRAEGRALLADLALAQDEAAVLDPATVVAPVVSGFGTDSAPRFQRAARYVRELIEGTELIEAPGADHGVHLSHPEWFASFCRAAVTAGGGPHGQRVRPR